MTHLTKKGEAKSLRGCTHPLRAKGVVNLIITDLALLEVTREGLLLKERAPDASLEEIIDRTATPLPLNVKLEVRPSI